MELSAPFQIVDLRSLLLLQRALLEARFFSGSPGQDLPGSPVLAKLHRDVVGRIMEHYKAIGDHRAELQLANWLEWSNRRLEMEALLSILRGMNPIWSTWGQHRQLEVASSLMVPFSHSDKDVEEVVRRVNEM